MCHILLQDPKFFQLLLRIDIDLAAQTLAGKCPCGGVLHKADYPRKPRGCPIEVRADYASRFSFCCSRCRKRSTAMSVRFLGRRVYLSLVVVLLSARRATVQDAGRSCPDYFALANLVGSIVPSNAALAGQLRPLHAFSGDDRASGQPDRALYRPGGGINDAATGLSHPLDGAPMITLLEGHA